MRQFLGIAFFAVFFPAHASANTGIFFGSGHTIVLGKTAQVQLVSEDVTITPKCGWTYSTDSVDYRCKFVLKNLTKEPVKIQVGFPLDSQLVAEAIQEGKHLDETDLVLNYHFIAHDEKNTYHTRFQAGDGEKKFARIFRWDMAFDPDETKVLHVAYQLRMSQVAGAMNKETMKKYEKPWHAALAQCFVEQFGYVTETGKSWAGSIEKATFRVQTGEWDHCLNARFVLDSEPPEPKAGQLWWEYGFPLRAGAIYRIISPEGGKCETEEGYLGRNTMTWEYKDDKPGEPFQFAYFMVAFPRSATDCDTWVRHVLGGKPGKEDLTELREIAAAFYGLAPEAKSAKKFVEQQRWYHPKKGLRESELKPEQIAILKRLDAITKAEGN